MKTKINKYTNNNHYKILISYKEITNTHKLYYQPLFSLSSYLVCWLGSILFSFMQQNNWKLIFNVELIKMYIILRINDFIHLKHVTVEMAPHAMQLCPFPWQYSCTRFWTSLPTHFTYHLVHSLGFSQSFSKCKMTLNHFYIDMKNKYSKIKIIDGTMLCSSYRYIC